MINIDIDPSIEINTSVYVLSYYSPIARKQINEAYTVPEQLDDLKSMFRVLTKGNYPNVEVYKLYIEVEQLTQHDLTSLE